MKSFTTYISLNASKLGNTALKDHPENFSEMHAKYMMSQGGSRKLFSGTYVSAAMGPVDESVLSYDDVKSWEYSTDVNKKTIYDYCKWKDISTDPKPGQSDLDNAYNNYIKSRTDKNPPRYSILKFKSFPSIDAYTKANKEETNMATEVRNSIKKHIMEKGSVYASISSPKGKNVCGIHKENGVSIERTLFQRTKEQATETTHGVSLVGWDDNFSKDHFDWIEKCK